ncbi:Retrovirus-related Pol polyprotein from transposon 412 [Araneus ventricosus]|uniref:RNA-directed DNA polymerase n=1 Tax=Araneus ventricosus TaxID=182803 RepID=A0A4Y2SQH4_ARAVE|nr:Retrovirus-related Pol polyprotein from transposon 412 [Araneus ventricosus]
MTGNHLDVRIGNKPIRALVDSGTSFSVFSDKYRRYLKKVMLSDAKNNCSHDVILGWNFLEASQAVLDCGKSELFFEGVCQELSTLEAWKLYAIKDCTLNPNSLTKITVSESQVDRDLNIVVKGNKNFLFERNIAVLSLITSYHDSKAEPLHLLLKGDAKFHWCLKEVEAFNNLKKALTSYPVLGIYDENSPTEIHTDVSGYGIGAVLVQIQNEAEKVIAYASRTLTKAEKNYSTTERECLAAVWAVHKFRPYLFGKAFTIVMDYHSLCWLMSLQDPSGRLARWALLLQEYDISIVYKSDIAEEQRKDSDLQKIISSKEKSQPIKTSYELVDRILCKKNFDPNGRMWLPLIPKHLCKDILRYFHGAPTTGHLEFDRT